MKKQILFTFCFLILCQSGFAQKKDTRDFYSEIKKLDVTEFILVSNTSIGFLGADYQRFYIHFTSVQKDGKNPFQYLVKGKTKVKENICTFSGIITLKKAVTFKVDQDDEIPQDVRAGKFTASVVLQEDKSQYGSGEITGTLTKGFVLKAGKMMDDNMLYYGDMPYEGNYFDGNWTSYSSGKSKRCMWHNGGGWTAQQDLFRLGDDGDVYINLQYLKNGWENYVAAYHPAQLEIEEEKQIHNAQLKEQEKWWQ